MGPRGHFSEKKKDDEKNRRKRPNNCKRGRLKKKERRTLKETEVGKSNNGKGVWVNGGEGDGIVEVFWGEEGKMSNRGRGKGM